ncbi:MAG TPA: MFS transporter [Terriglobia bacterium]|nr:MFS transporter [Terriglobia bacterium]
MATRYRPSDPGLDQGTLPLDRSYRALLKVPAIGPLLLGMQIARIGQSMVSVTIVLFALTSYRSAVLAGLATFFGIFPGLVVSPIAGALLDRHGRVRLVVLDYLVALASLTLIGTLALRGTLPAWLLMVIAAVASLTTPLSATGLRSLFPLIIPTHLWERVNALDSTGYVIASVLGPPLAAGLVALWGGAVAFIIIGLSFGLAAIVIARSPEPPSQTALNKPLLVEAWQGLVYTWNNPTLRGLGFSISVVNLVSGAFTIVVPLMVLERFHLNETVVGLVFAVQGLTGIVSAVIFGRIDSRNRERIMLAVPMVAAGMTVAVLLLKSNLAVLVLVMGITGFLNGPLDIALFTLRQRRTDTAWTGRAFAVSMSFNYLGIPVGSALAGIIAARSIEWAIAFGVVASLIAGLLAAVMIPSTE